MLQIPTTFTHFEFDTFRILACQMKQHLQHFETFSIIRRQSTTMPISYALQIASIDILLMRRFIELQPKAFFFYVIVMHSIDWKIPNM